MESWSTPTKSFKRFSNVSRLKREDCTTPVLVLKIYDTRYCRESGLVSFRTGFFKFLIEYNCFIFNLKIFF